MSPDEVALPPELARESLEHWQTFGRSTRRLLVPFALLAAGVLVWILVYTQREERFFAPRSEELWPEVGCAALLAMFAWVARWTRGPEPLRAALCEPDARVTWVGLRFTRMRGQLRYASLMFGFARGKVVFIGLNAERMPEQEHIALARRVEAEARTHFRPRYLGGDFETERAYRKNPSGA